VADELGAVRRTPRPTGDRQTPETVAQPGAGTTNAPTPVSADAGNGTDDLSPEVAAALVEHHGPELEARADLARHGLDQLRGKLHATAVLGHLHTTDNDMQAFVELPDCLACEGTGKDDHSTVFEEPLAVHFAAPCVTVHGRRRQLCLWCGHVLMDDDLTRPTVEDDEPIFQAPWPDGALVKVENGYTSQVPYRDGDELPPGCCALPADGEPAWAADRPPAAVEADNALRLHLASVHKLANAFALTAADAADAHQHDHFGPCGLRNHDIADRSYDEAEARAVVAEADDGPDEAQETRAAADWPAEPVDTHADEQEADRG
jgi:hypothetical protein